MKKVRFREINSLDEKKNLNGETQQCTEAKEKEDDADQNGMRNKKKIEEAETGTLEEQLAFIEELHTFYREQGMEFKPPKFYGKLVNCLKLYRAVTRLGGYDHVTEAKLWREVGESFHPPKTCTTVSWTFRNFYEKALLEYERLKLQNGEIKLAVAVVPVAVKIENEENNDQPPASASGRVRRESAARAMQGWHELRQYGYGEITEPIIKDKTWKITSKRGKKFKSTNILNGDIDPVSVKQKSLSELLFSEKAAPIETSKQLATTVVDVGSPADWVKINVKECKDYFEVYALVPGLLREEIRIQTEPAGRLVITGQPEQVDNPWGIKAFKKVVSLPARINPLRTSAVVSLHGRLSIRVPFEQSDI